MHIVCYIVAFNFRYILLLIITIFIIINNNNNKSFQTFEHAIQCSRGMQDTENKRHTIKRGSLVQRVCQFYTGFHWL